MATPFTADQPFKENNVINESERDAIPANDVGRLVQLEADGELSTSFIKAGFIGGAGENLTAGSPVGINEKGLLVRAMRIKPSDATNVPSGTLQLWDVARLEANKYIVTFKITSEFANPSRAVVATVNPETKTVSFGNSVSTGFAESVTGQHPNVCSVSPTQAVVTHLDGSNRMRLVPLTISGNSVVAASGGDIFTAFDPGSNIGPTRIGRVSDGKFFAYGNRTNLSTHIQVFGEVAPGGTSVINAKQATSGNPLADSQNSPFAICGVGEFKVLMVNGRTGEVAAADCTSSISWGAVVGVGGGSASGGNRTSLLSLSNDTAFVRVSGNVRHITITGTTITNGGSVGISDDNGGVLFEQGGKVYEMHTSTDANKSGLYLITETAGTVTRSLVKQLSGSTTSVCDGGEDDFLGFFSLEQYTISGMANNYVGCVQDTVLNSANVSVRSIGRQGNQAGLISGVNYSPLDGTFVIDSQGRNTAINSTEIILN